MSGKGQPIEVRVSEVIPITPLVKRFRLERPNGEPLPTFSGGAHVIVEMSDGEVTRRNAYSLMSSPFETSHYTISVRRDAEGRGGSVYLHDRLKAGDTLHISRPVNFFPIEQRAKRHILVAGGIGITPFLAMMDQMEKDDRTFELHYASRSREHAAYAENLIARYGRRIHFYHEEQGERVPLAQVLKLQPIGTHLYVCGPSGMIEWVLGVAADLGWPPQNLHFERFLSPPSGKPYDIRLAESGLDVHVGEHQSMLEAIEAAGVDAPFLCRGGVCGQCETKVLECEGELIHADHYLSEADKASRTKVMPCVSRFEGRMLVLAR